EAEPLRGVEESDDAGGHGQIARIFDAAGPFWPCVGSNSTFWPSLRDLKPPIWISVWWAKRSLPPSSGVMNPKPFASLNHLTVPVAMSFLFYYQIKRETVRAPLRAR